MSSSPQKQSTLLDQRHRVYVSVSMISADVPIPRSLLVGYHIVLKRESNDICVCEEEADIRRAINDLLISDEDLDLE